MKKFFLILRLRWWAFLVVGSIGLLAGIAFASLRNQGIEPNFKAEAEVVLVRRGDDESGRELRGRIDESQRVAIRANQFVLEPGTAEINSTVGETDGRIVFVGFDGEETAAIDLATSMRDRYLEAAPIGVGAVDEELTAYSDQVDQIRNEISDLEAQGQGGQESEQTRNLLTAQIAQLQNEAVNLAVELALYDFRQPENTREAIEAELEATQESILELQSELERLPDEASTDTERDLRIQALRQQEANITASYLDLFLNQAEAAALTSVGGVAVANESETPVSPRLAAVGGFILGILVALTSALMFDFARKPIWSTADLGQVRGIGTLAPRRLSASRKDPWYPQTHRGRRLDDIQAIRASVDVVIGHGPVAIGVARIGVSPKESKAVAADLAASLAAVGNSVLLIDADFASPSGFPEYGARDTTLVELLGLRDDAAVARVKVKESLERIEPVIPNLRGVAAGYLEANSADVLGGHLFEVVIGEARELADVILVAGPVATGPSALILAQRLDYMMIVAKSRSTRVPELEAAVAALDGRRAGFLGAILLDRRHRGIWRPAGMHVPKTK